MPLLPTTLLLSLLALLSNPLIASASSDFEIGEVCGKLNGGGYTNQYLCSQDRKSVIVCQATINSLLLPTWQLDRACHGDHFCYALQGGGMESQWGNAPMEPNGYPSDDPTSFGCRKLLGLEDQKDEGQVIMRDGGEEEEEEGDGEEEKEKRDVKRRERRGGSVLGEW